MCMKITKGLARTVERKSIKEIGKKVCKRIGKQQCKRVGKKSSRELAKKVCKQSSVNLVKSMLEKKQGTRQARTQKGSKELAKKVSNTAFTLAKKRVSTARHDTAPLVSSV